MNPKNHPLVKKFPLNGTHRTSEGDLPSPYVVYDGQVAFIGGIADYAAVRELIAAESLTPLKTAEGKAFMALWVCDFTDASLGAHSELQLSLFATRESTTEASYHPLSLFQVLTTRPEACMICHRLWNNTTSVVAYNREAMHLDAHLAQSVIAFQREGQATQMMFGFTVNGESLVEGTLHFPKRQENAVIVDLMKLMGVIPFIRGAFAPTLALKVVNTQTVDYPYNAEAQTYTARQSVTLKYFNPSTDRLQINVTPYGDLGFVPTFAQLLTGIKFVYLDPKQV